MIKPKPKHEPRSYTCIQTIIMDPEYYSDLPIIIVVLFSCGFSILYWRIWLRVWSCVKACFQPERLWGIAKNYCRYVLQLPCRAYYALYKRMGISVLFAEVFPDDTNPNFEGETENQVIYDHDAEANNTECNEFSIELVPLPGVDNNSTSSLYSSHRGLQQTEVLGHSPVFSANPHESKEDVLSSDANESLVDSRVADWVTATAEYLTTLYDETAATTPAE